MASEQSGHDCVRIPVMVSEVVKDTVDVALRGAGYLMQGRERYVLEEYLCPLVSGHAR